MERFENHKVTKTKSSCSNFDRMVYDLSFNISESFIDQLTGLGTCYIYQFSKYSSYAKDTFNVQDERGFSIHGVMGSDSLIVMTPKGKHLKKIKLDKIINTFIFNQLEYSNNI